jgi:hypothetical protein
MRSSSYSRWTPIIPRPISTISDRNSSGMLVRLGSGRSDQAGLIRGRYCGHYRGLRDWRTAIRKQNCNKGRMMSFLYWICETYLAKKRKKGKRKSVN